MKTILRLPKILSARSARRDALLPSALLSAAVVALALAAPAQAAQTVEVQVTQRTGTMPFDLVAGSGNDTGATNDVVRSHDQVTYEIEFNVNDDASGSSTASNVTIVQTLPAGMSWIGLPATCLTSGVTPPSQIVGQTLTCNVGDIATGTARTLELSATVDEDTDGLELIPAVDSVVVTADDAEPDSATPDSVFVSSIPRVDMVKNSAPTVTVVASGGSGGVPGYNIAYPVSVRIPDFGGRGLIGYSPPDALMTLVDDYSGVSPNAELVGCATGSGGTWTCTPGVGQTADVEIELDDPDSHTGAGVLSSSTVTIFVPATDLPTPGSLNVTNAFEDLDATGSGGTVEAVGENPANNSYTFQLSSSAAGSFFKHYVDVTAPGRYVPGGPNVDRNGATVVNAGQIFQAEVRMGSTNAIAGFDSIAACDVFDTVTQEATTDGDGAAGNGGQPAWITANSVTGGPALVAGTDFVLEYSTVATSTDPDDATRWAALRATDCGGAPGDWSTTPPADPADVTKVRVRLLTDPPNQFTLAFAVNLRAKPGVDGTRIANFMAYQTDADVDADPWVDSTYEPSTHAGARGDRLTLSAATTRLSKDIVDPAVGPTVTPSVLGGALVRFRLRPEVVAPAQGGTGPVTARDVRVYDILPAGTTLVTDPGQEPSPALAEPPVVNGDGTTLLVWALGDVESGETPAIEYTVRVSTATAGNKVNRAIVTSPDDVGSLDPENIPTTGNDPRFATRTINVQVLAGIQIDKSVRREVIEPGDDVIFDVTYANLYSTPVSDLQTIDVLPFNSDGVNYGPVPGRNQPSSFHGGYTLEEVVAGDGEIVEYTDADPEEVYAHTDQTAGGAATYGQLPVGDAWCDETAIAAEGAGCPASIAVATAVRITRTGALAGLSSRQLSLRIRPYGNRSGDVYGNTAALRAPALTLGTLSPTANTRVVASRIGDYVWDDLNRNGLQDAGEPGVAGVRVTLQGTDKRSNPVSVTTTTGPDGRYMFTSSTQAGQDEGGFLDLVSGSYRSVFDPATLPPRASFTIRDAAGDDGLDSDADPGSGATAFIALPDPSPTGVDGEDLTLDAGIAIAPAPPVEPPPVTPDPRPSDRRPRLSVTKVAGRSRVRAGDRVRYRIRVRNTGTAVARNLRVCDLLPSQLTVVSIGGGGRFSNGNVCWRVTLRPRASRTFTLVARVDRDAGGGRVRNRVAVTGGGARIAGRRRAAAAIRVLPARERRSASRVTG